MGRSFETVIDNLAFPEGPRWREGELWFSDMYSGRVIRWRPGGEPTTVLEVPEGEAVSGLGFLPDGRLLVVAMHARQVLRLDPDGLRLHADVSDIATGHANDMLVDAAGCAYVGNFGDESVPPDPVTPAVLARVDPDGSVHVAADGLELPNGMALVDGGATLVVAETRAIPPRITTYAVAVDGSLSDRRTLIQLTNELPDGISVGADDVIWFASPFTGEVICLSRDGEILERVACPVPPYACVVADDTLYICAAHDWRPDVAVETRSGVMLSMPLLSTP